MSCSGQSKEQLEDRLREIREEERHIVAELEAIERREVLS